MLSLVLAGLVFGDFRVLPHLMAPHKGTILVTWHTVADAPGSLEVEGVGRFVSRPREMPQLRYSELEEKERTGYPDMFPNRDFKHQILVKGLKPGSSHPYVVRQGRSIHRGVIRTVGAGEVGTRVRIIAFGDSETEPEGRTRHNPWSPGPQAPGSTGRPAGQPNYLVTETEGFIQNLKVIRERKPDLLVLAGDIVQGGGYQRAWDEFWHHMAGKFDDPLSSIPLVAAIGNWENFGARNGGYTPAGIAASRRKYSAYLDGPSNGSRDHQNFYHRIDMGPVTLITLDSSNGLPDGTDNDTNINIAAKDYPGRDLVDAAPGGRQWKWCLEQLRDAQAKGQVIFVQFHHIPYSGGGHILPTTVEGSSGQAGIVMRAYTPWFQKHGVAAVFCGHNESFEWSEVGSVQFFDAGVAGDGLGRPIDDIDKKRVNPWRKWVAHFDEPELWKGRQLVQGGRHYGHLEVDIEWTAEGPRVSYTPVHVFPVTNEEGQVVRFERRPCRPAWSHFPKPLAP